mgnify:CR=1 FL=1
MNPPQLIKYLDTHTGRNVEPTERIHSYAIRTGVVIQVSAMQMTVLLAIAERAIRIDLETSIESGKILCAAAVVEQYGNSETHTFRGDEREMLEGLTRLVRDSDPDIITGYNIDNFDLPKIKERMEALEDRKDRLTRAILAGWGRVPATEEACTAGSMSTFTSITSCSSP